MTISPRMIVGFGASILCVMLCGIGLSFNVYAVTIKRLFNLTQTQDELMGAFSSAGWSAGIVGAIVRERYGYMMCYVLTTFLLTSWCVFMWISTIYRTFFSKWIGLMYLFQYFYTAGAAIGTQVLPSITIEHFPKHTGKVFGGYVSIFGIGNAFYSALYQIAFRGDPERLGVNFLTCGVILVVSFSLCAIFHRPPINVTGDEETTILVSSEHGTSALIQINEHEMQSNVDWRYLLTSWAFYLLVIPTFISNASMVTFLDNISVMADSVGVTDYFGAIYLFSVAAFILRPVFGGIYDHFQSQKVGVYILLCCYVPFCVGMLWSIFDLNNITVIIIIAISTFGYAVDLGIWVSMMTSEFGTQYFSLIVGAVDLLMAPTSALLHLLTGLTYDRAYEKLLSPDMLCPQCLQGMFKMFIISITVSLFFVVLYFFMKYKCRRQAS